VRTTVQLPDELFQAAKVEAAARGETLKEFLTRAVSHELGSAVAATERGRVELPLVGSAHPGASDIDNADIAAIFAAEDAEKYVSH
jgi:hypothetical protein